MKKQVVFMHQTYPTQFGPISEFLLRNYDVDVAFFSEHISTPVAGLRKAVSLVFR